MPKKVLLGITFESAAYFSFPQLSVVNAARGQKIRLNREKISMASGMRQLPGTLRFQVVQESHTSGLTPAARGEVDLIGLLRGVSFQLAFAV